MRKQLIHIRVNKVIKILKLKATQMLEKGTRFVIFGGDILRPPPTCFSNLNFIILRGVKREI